jgi:flagellar basal-body rod protein FlgG
MIRGLYTGAAGMVAQMHKMDALSNNLANVNLNGYKKDTSIHKAFPEMLIRRLNDNGLYKFPMGSAEIAPIVGKVGTGVEQNEVFTNFDQGALKETENPFDMALEGKGFFAVDTPTGERYTRNGAFTLGKEGFPVLGEKGPIHIKENNFIIDQRGRIFKNSAFPDDPQRLISMIENEWGETELIDTIKLVDFKRDRYLRKQGNSLWKDTAESGAASIMEESATKVRQGFVEGSNVNPVKEMVNMIEVNRAYEANQKVVSSQDALTGKLINDAVKL